jgi:KDO2-lipid IV(A) lauroyltransferase
MAKPRSIPLDWLQYVALRLVTMGMHVFPIESNLAFARFIGDLLYRFDHRHRQRAMGNLRRSFPGLGERELARHARSSMQSLILLGIETLFTTRLVRPDTLARYLTLGDWAPVLRLLMQKDHGVIMLTGHYGNWEILGYALATMGFETVSVARPLDNKFINHWLLGVRERMGQRIIAKKGATEEVVQTLAARGVVAFIADQNAGPKGLFVDFFGRKASTYKSIGLLAIQYRAPVVIGYARREPGHFRFHAGLTDIIYPSDWEGLDDPLLYITQRYTAAIEKFVREEPGQYLWVHRRWKTRPKGEAPEQFD